MTTFLVIVVLVLILGCALAKAMTSSMILKSRQKLAAISAEEMKTASLRRQVEAHLKVLQDKERQVRGDQKKLKAQLSEVQAQLDEPNGDEGVKSD